MFADRTTIELLSETAESHADVNRSGKRVAATTPDRSKHMKTIRQHFDERAKRSFGYWNALDYFLERSVFRAGLRLQWHPNQIYAWKKQVLDNIASLFARGASGSGDGGEERERETAKLYATIGQLTVERDFLARRPGR